MQDYGTTRAIGQFVAAAGWVVVALGIILLLVAFGTMSSGFGLLALAPAIGIILGGLLLICQGQLAQAIVDTAHNTAEVARSTAELVRLLRDTTVRGTEANATLNAPPTAVTLGTIRHTDHKRSATADRAQLVSGREYNSYRGYDITAHWGKNGWSYHTVGRDFSTLESAADCIDQLEDSKRA